MLTARVETVVKGCGTGGGIGWGVAKGDAEGGVLTILTRESLGFLLHKIQIKWVREWSVKFSN